MCRCSNRFSFRKLLIKAVNAGIEYHVEVCPLRVHGLQVALQSRQTMFRKSQPLMSGFEWIIILFVGIIPFRAAEVVAEALGCSHLVALACGIVVMAICVLGYFAIRPMMLPD
jgi:hypothetical protein